MQESFEKFKKNFKKNFKLNIIKIFLIITIILSIPLTLSFYKHHQHLVFVASEKFYLNKYPNIPFTGHACEETYFERLFKDLDQQWCSNYVDGVRTKSTKSSMKTSKNFSTHRKKDRYYHDGKLAIETYVIRNWMGEEWSKSKIDENNSYKIYFESDDEQIDDHYKDFRLEREKIDETCFGRCYELYESDLLNGHNNYIELGSSKKGTYLKYEGHGSFKRGQKIGEHVLMCPHKNGKKYNKGIIRSIKNYEHFPYDYGQYERVNAVEFDLTCPHQYKNAQNNSENIRVFKKLYLDNKYSGFMIEHKVPVEFTKDVYQLRLATNTTANIQTVYLPTDMKFKHKYSFINRNSNDKKYRPYDGFIDADINMDLKKLKNLRKELIDFDKNYEKLKPDQWRFLEHGINFSLEVIETQIQTTQLQISKLKKNNDKIILTKKTKDKNSKCKGVDTKKWTNCFGTFSPQDGFLYSGEFKNGMMHGKGTLERKNISKHTGNFKNGYADGQGTISYVSGDIFKGAFKNGMAHGHGVKIYKNGQKYVGEWQQGQRNGLGVYSWKSGTQYIGEFKDSREHGQGTKTYPDGTKYTGEFQKGMPHGVVEATYKDGTKYIGNYKLNNRNGLGRFEYSDGTIFLGEWNDGVKEGSGMLIMKDGGIFMGKFKNDIANGRGLLVPPSSDALFGDWNGHQVLREINLCDHNNKESGCISVLGDKSDGRLYIGESRYRTMDGSKYNTMNGIGKMMFSSGEIFFGEFKNNIMEGFGFMFFTDGRIYFGDYFDDGQEGNGAMFFPNNEFIFGEYKNDQPVQGTMTFNNGTKYIGEYKNGRQNGFGILVRHDGLFKYEGEWKDDKRHGNGVNKYYDTERKSLGSYKGEFRENKRYKGKTTLPDGTEVELDEDWFNELVEEFGKNKSN